MVKDFNFLPLRERITPLVINIGPVNYVAVRVAPGAVPAALEVLQQTWSEFEQARPFEYAFLDESIDAVYHTEARMQSMFMSFTVLAILIACLGLFALSAFAAEQRTKEIGIRKVLGASVAGIVGLLSKEFLRLVVLAFIIATPVAYVIMTRWLNDFAYRIDLSASPFLLAGMLAFGIALLTVSYQSIKAALADPVKSLRYE